MNNSASKQILEFANLAPKQLFYKDCCDFLDKLPEDEKICIGCSGGSDSISLIYFLLSHYGNLAKNVTILHFNHNLRGEESDQDEIFVKHCADVLGLHFISEKLDTRGLNVSESALRDKRYEFFSRKMYDFGSKIILLGQQKNDIAETMLMRLTRSSGTGGLSSPRPIAIIDSWQVRIRPLLSIKKSQIEEILTKIGQSWRTDNSNFSNDFFRNRIRNNVIPEIQSSIPQYDVIDSFAESRKLLQEDDDALNLIANQYFDQATEQTLHTKNLSNLPRAIIRRVLHNWLSNKDIIVQKQNFEKILSAICEKKYIKISISIGKFLVLKGDLLRFIQ